jgi:N-acetylneuraminate lyase
MNLHGILPALITPFDAECRVNGESLEMLLERLYAAGAHGVYACGQTGEGLLQTVEQRKTVAEVVMANSPKEKQVVIHVGAQRPAEAFELARHASKIGATAVSSLPFAGAYSFEEARAYYRKLAASVDIPVLVYFFPEVCPAVRGAEQVIELTQIPNVAGVKFTDFNLYGLATIKETGAVVFNGRDEVLAAGLLMGADGGVGSFYNLVPGLFVELYDLACRNEWQQARAVQRKINELIRITLKFPLLPAMKQMLGWAGINCGTCLASRRALTDDEKRLLQAALAQSSFERDAFANALVK